MGNAISKLSYIFQSIKHISPVRPCQMGEGVVEIGDPQGFLVLGSRKPHPETQRQLGYDAARSYLLLPSLERSFCVVHCQLFFDLEERGHVIPICAAEIGGKYYVERVVKGDLKGLQNPI
jgi:hypothetical protein